MVLGLMIFACAICHIVTTNSNNQFLVVHKPLTLRRQHYRAFRAFSPPGVRRALEQTGSQTVMASSSRPGGILTGLVGAVQ